MSHGELRMAALVVCEDHAISEGGIKMLAVLTAARMVIRGATVQTLAVRRIQKSGASLGD